MEKGKTNNPNGRPKGSGNKLSAELRSKLLNFANQSVEDIDMTFWGLEPKDRADFLIKVLTLVMPRLETTTLEKEEEAAGEGTVKVPAIFGDLIKELANPKAN